MNCKQFFNSKTIAKLGIFTALAFVLYMMEFPIVIMFPSFLRLNFSDIPVLICGFYLGPVAGCFTVLAKVLLKIPFSYSFGVGEIGSLITGVAFVLPASLIYKKYKTVKGALCGILAGAVSSIVAALLCNAFILIPAYSLPMGGYGPLVAMCSPFVPNITEQNFMFYYLTLIALPFNLLRCVVMGLLTFILYKRVSNLLKKF